jgi:hypothetical protein
VNDVHAVWEGRPEIERAARALAHIFPALLGGDDHATATNVAAVALAAAHEEAARAVLSDLADSLAALADDLFDGVERDTVHLIAELVDQSGHDLAAATPPLRTP